MKSEISIALLKKDITYIKKGVEEISNSLNCMVKNDDDYKELKYKVDSLWDSKNKMVGWMLGAGIAGGGISALLNSLVKTVSAIIK